MSRKIVDPYEYEHHVSATNKTLVRDFLTEKKSQKKSKNTVRQYEQDMRIILTYIYRHFDNKSLLKLTRKDVRNLAMMFIERDLSAARVNRLIGTLRVALSYFEDDEDQADYIVNVAAKVRGLAKNPVRTITFLTEEQIFWLKDTLLERKKTLMAVYLMLSYMSAGRRNEVHQVLKDGLTERFKTNVVTGKRAKKFPLYYDRVTQDLIRQYLAERGPDDDPNLFVKVYANGRKQLVHPSTFNEWCDYMSEIISCHFGRNIPMNPHCFRHSRIEHLCRVKKFPLEKVKSIANHASVATTETYLADRAEDDVMELFEMEPEMFSPTLRPEKCEHKNVTSHSVQEQYYSDTYVHTITRCADCGEVVGDESVKMGEEDIASIVKK